MAFLKLNNKLARKSWHNESGDLPQQSEFSPKPFAQNKWNALLLFGFLLALFLLSPPLLYAIEYWGKNYAQSLLPFYLFGLWFLIILLIYIFSLITKRNQS